MLRPHRLAIRSLSVLLVTTFLRAQTTSLPASPDHQFDNGSNIQFNQLSPVQISNLVVLGKVWGFLKYHHPQVVSGKRQWDYDLLRVLLQVLAADDRNVSEAAIVHWIDSLGPIVPCDPCAKLREDDLQLRPDVNWIYDRKALGTDLSDRLQRIYVNRGAVSSQAYVSLNTNVPNPDFKEVGYENVKFPDAGFQLLAVYRFWNIVEYWSPYRDLVGEDWDAVLADFIPKVALAKTADEYKLQLMALVGMAHDTHANLWGSLEVRPPVGNCAIPVGIRFVSREPVVFRTPELAEPTTLRLGDVITAIDGKPVKELVQNWQPYYAASNDAARMNAMAFSITQGKCGDTMLRVRRGDGQIQVKAQRVENKDLGARRNVHDLSGDTFRLLSRDVAYLKLSSVKMADAAQYIEQAKGTKGLIIDIRNYPSEFVVYALGSFLVDKPTEFSRFTQGDLSNPGAFHWGYIASLQPSQRHYSGKVVILVDETSISQAEFTAMAFRVAPGAIVVGSTTEGADGNVSPFALPGGVRTMISGIGVFYPDKKPTQRIGILPDVVVTPTVSGIRAGRDEVVDEAVRQITGKHSYTEDHSAAKR